MKSRMEKYSSQKPSYNRTTKNANLYKEVYGNYVGLENLPIADNTNEINMEELQEMVRLSERKQTRRVIQEEQEELISTRKQEEQKEYDINKILEKAKSTNRPKEEKKPLSPTYKFLTTLESQELPVSEIKKAYLESTKETKADENKDEELYMTRELKFHNKQLEVTREINLMKEDNSSPLDLLEDLKPDGNTFISEPVKIEKDSIFAKTSEEENITPKIEKIESNQKENEDIDIIKKETFKDAPQIDDDFYTSSYKFSKRDFIDDEDDFYDKPNKSFGVLKVILLLIAIFALTTVIYYFISKYGIGV